MTILYDLSQQASETATLRRGTPWRSLSVADYEDGVQAILDKYGHDLVEVRTMARATGTLLDCKIEISRYLRTLNVSYSQIGRLLNCGEWLARYYSAPDYRKWRMAQYRSRHKKWTQLKKSQKSAEEIMTAG